MPRIERARATARAQVWRQIVARGSQIPSARGCYGDRGATIVIRLDASTIITHSHKTGAKRTWKGTYGHHPLLAVCDNTGELVVAMLRPGNAGSSTGADHVQVLDAAIAQIPASFRRDLLVTIDGAGAGHEIVDQLKTWPADLRVIVRREPIPVGMQVSLFEQHDGY